MEPIFEAVLKGEREVTRLLRKDPAVARTRAAGDHLVEAIPHWVYGGDTSLHLAAAGLWTGVARALLESGRSRMPRIDAARLRSTTRVTLGRGPVGPDCVLKARRSSPLHLAAQCTGAGGTQATLAEQLAVELLLRQGADPSAADVAGRTPADGRATRESRRRSAVGAADALR